MNKERLELLATHLEQFSSNHSGLRESGRPGFNMNWWVAHKEVDYSGMLCDTVFCIAGHAVLLFDEIIDGDPISLKAREILGLDRETAEKLFYNYYDDEVTPSQ